MGVLIQKIYIKEPSVLLIKMGFVGSYAMNISRNPKGLPPFGVGPKHSSPGLPGFNRPYWVLVKEFNLSCQNKDLW